MPVNFVFYDRLNLMKIILLITLTLLSIKVYASKDCIHTLGAFDIGSGATRITVAKVNHCRNQILEVLHQKQISLFFKKDLDNSDERKLSKGILKQAISDINKLKKEALVYNPKKFVGVATEAFRSALNGQAFVNQLIQALGFKIIILDQKTEATLGYFSALHHLKIDGKEILVWDHGGGSAQFTTVDENYNIQIASSKMGSETFKNLIIYVLKGLDPHKVSTPNPIGKKNGLLANRLAYFEAKNFLPNYILNKAQTATVIGIGGIHYWSIRKTLGRKNMDSPYSQKDLLKAIEKNAQKTDKQVGGKYAATDISNLHLIYGFMKALGVSKVKSLDLNMSHGILLNKDFWN